MIRSWVLFILCFGLLRGAELHAEVPPAPVTAADADTALAVLKDDAKRAELIRTLETIARASQAAPKPAGSAAKIERALDTVATGAAAIGTEALGMVRLAHGLPEVAARLREDWADERMRAEMIGDGWRGAAILALGFGAGALVRRRLSRRAATMFAHKDDRSMLRRIPRAAAGLTLDIAPAFAFAAIVFALASMAFPPATAASRIMLDLAGAFVASGLLHSTMRIVFSPALKGRRLLALDDRSAVAIESWVVRFCDVVIFGTALADIAASADLGAALSDDILRVVGLAAHLLLIAIVLESRRTVASAIRGAGQGSAYQLRRQLAATWHFIAIFAIVALWVVWVTASGSGYVSALRAIAIPIGIVIAVQIIHAAALTALERNNRPFLRRRRRLLRGILTGAILFGASLAILTVWGVDAIGWLTDNGLGRHLFSSALDVLIASLVALMVWEAANSAIEGHMAGLNREANPARSARVRTLLPILRAILRITIVTLLVFIGLSELGVNIAPLLAGAGIVGVAVGFGSQTLVKDLITGIFLLLENAMQVGDWVTVAGLSGTVEQLSIRTLRLRAADGSMHLIPFSAVTSVTNVNRGIGNVPVSVSVRFSEDVDRVSRLVKEIAHDLGSDPAFAPLMLAGLELWGVDRADALMVTISGQIPCTDAGRWPIQREFQRRMKLKFQEAGIELLPSPITSVTVQMPIPAPRPASP